MTASPLSTNIYDQVNPLILLMRTGRHAAVHYGSFPVKTFQAQNGAEIRILYGKAADRQKAQPDLRQRH